MPIFQVKQGSDFTPETDLTPFIVSGGSVGLGHVPQYLFDVDGDGRFTGNIFSASPVVGGHVATKEYVDLYGGGSGSGEYIDITSTPQTKDGDLTLNGRGTMETLDLTDAEITANSISISVVTPVLIDSFSQTASRTAEYTFQLTQGSSYTVTKVILIHNGTDINIAEYGYVSVGTAIDYVFDAAFSLGNLELTCECSTANVTTVSIKFSRVLLDT